MPIQSTSKIMNADSSRPLLHQYGHENQTLRMHELQVWFLAEHWVDTPLVHS